MNFLETYNKLFNDPNYNKHDSSELRYQHVVNYINNNKEIKNIIDISSGRGILLTMISNLFPKINITSTDINKYNELNFKFYKLNLINNEDYIQIPNNFDLLTCLDVLEHIDYQNIENVLDNLSRLSKTFIFTIANHIDIQNGIDVHLIKEDTVYWGNILSKKYIINNCEEKNFNGNYLYIYNLSSK